MTNEKGQRSCLLLTLVKVVKTNQVSGTLINGQFTPVWFKKKDSSFFRPNFFLNQIDCNHIHYLVSSIVVFPTCTQNICEKVLKSFLTKENWFWARADLVWNSCSSLFFEYVNFFSFKRWFMQYCTGFEKWQVDCWRTFAWGHILQLVDISTRR